MPEPSAVPSPATATATTWSPDRYLRFADERSRPFLDLAARISGPEPTQIADLGCGPGNATELLAERWPGARILGVDSSAEMIAAAQPRRRPGRLDFVQADLRDWRPERPLDVLITNATLQWVPGHLALLPRLLGLLAPGGRLALGVPGNFGAPSHTVLTELQRSPAWSGKLSGEQFRPASHQPAEYLRALTAAGARAEVWETTYYYVLDGETGVADFVSSTALRPVFTELGGPESADSRAFLAEYTEQVRAAYPPEPFGPDSRVVQILPYRRLFAVAQV